MPASNHAPAARQDFALRCCSSVFSQTCTVYAKDRSARPKNRVLARIWILCADFCEILLIGGRGPALLPAVVWRSYNRSELQKYLITRSTSVPITSHIVRAQHLPTQSICLLPTIWSQLAEPENSGLQWRYTETICPLLQFSDTNVPKINHMLTVDFANVCAT